MPKSKTSAKKAPKHAAKSTKPAAAVAVAAPRSGQGWSDPCNPPPLGNGKATIRLLHAASPTCWWTWGYEATLHRVRLVYGNQVEIRIVLAPVYTDLKEYLAHYGSRKELVKEAEDASALMGVPIFLRYDRAKLPKDTLPVTLAAVAAYRQGGVAGEKFLRAIVRRSCVEGSDVSQNFTVLAAAREAGLDLKRFSLDRKDRDGLLKDLDAMNDGLPHMPLGFYNLIVEGDRGRRVVIDHAFEPADVERAIDYLGDRKLKKNRPRDPAVYLKQTGPAPLREIARVFAWDVAAAEKKMARLEKAGQVRQVKLAGQPHWTA